MSNEITIDGMLVVNEEQEKVNSQPTTTSSSSTHVSKEKNDQKEKIAVIEKQMDTTFPQTNELDGSTPTLIGILCILLCLIYKIKNWLTH
ncbi:hypothetical protein [Melissococcus plutonius]|uniref:Uncharacterized protein n=1 Tax=Melissococcus plutonius (strain ATCC 35311 / DSM 29964 / CIP 104052 / LMG 20360 / NCIMB 702443) TaxID=940190 RepID=F3YCR0_MELPT|nr:hypothetical protein [Melissococcus plutonius]AIM26122.1 hypothetical protein MEPL_178p000920 [Melissococcus plutonius S1]KMT23610.1 hypothetical protein MEPL2_5c01340 [Melissococcus plutonius]KMT23663.1 hypothetical protein MEPL3_9c00590 [Melissococcus plutonius]KMT24297.1 hypothetical protein MEPL1_10c00490 [Melissococcus plutonius]KMT28123.1 hypothetical protein MEPL4_7c00810 [Melissococcus plutonius]